MTDNSPGSIRFQITCTGRRLPGISTAEAKKNLARLFKTTPDKLTALFSGEPVVVKRGMDRATAETWKDATARCGVIFDIEAVDAAGNRVAVSDAPETPSEIPKAGGAPQPSGPPAAEASPEEAVAPPQQDAPPNASGAHGNVDAMILQATKIQTITTTQRLRTGFRWIRIALLLAVLIVVAIGTWWTRHESTNWDAPLQVVVFPIAGDKSARVSDYLATLSEDRFEHIERYLANEAYRFNLPLEIPIIITVAPPVQDMPPPPPDPPSKWDTIWWSLKLRRWAYEHSDVPGVTPDVRMYVAFYDYDGRDILSPSLGLPQGLIGVVHAYADEILQAKNNIIIAHELFHTLGATDKYNLSTGQPIAPSGLAEPDRQPQYPQRMAEIMGGRIAQTDSSATMPMNLDHTLVGPETAHEIGWTPD